MIARLQQFITVSLVLVAIGALVVFGYAGHVGWGIATVALIVLCHMAFLGIEFLMLFFVVRHLPTWRARPLAMVGAWLSEALHAPRAFCWRQPFRSEIWPDYFPDQGHQRGIVLVHGLLCNRGFWNPWMARLRADRVPSIGVNLEPLGGLLDGDLIAIDTAIAKMSFATGQPPVLVGHSRGGLVIRAWAALPGNSEKFHRIITIGTPHGGTWLARFALSPGSAEMRLGSPWLMSLGARETAESRARFTCFYSRCDNIVFPPPTATLEGADNREIDASAHIQMAFAPEVFTEVQRWLIDDTSHPKSNASSFTDALKTTGRSATKHPPQSRPDRPLVDRAQ